MVVNGEQLVKSSSMELVVLNAFEKVLPTDSNFFNDQHALQHQIWWHLRSGKILGRIQIWYYNASAVVAVAVETVKSVIT
jgi:hypothetical protein